MSEAGCPGVADPGAVIVKLAHEKGTSRTFSRSFFDTLGHDGIWNERPSFTFHGYLPIEKGEKVVLKI
jgi:16S rRNA (cytidine1402-2'-O)-methyltransferase